MDFKQNPVEGDHDTRYLSQIMAASVKKMLNRAGNVRLSQEPVIKTKPVTQFMQRLRVDGMEKFNNPTFISAIQLYASPQDAKENKILGTVIVYMEEAFLPEFMRTLKYPLIEDKEHPLKDACGTLANLITGRFKIELSKLGFHDMDISYFTSYRNTAVNGIPYNVEEKEKYEISFYIDGVKRLVVELITGRVPIEISEYEEEES